MNTDIFTLYSLLSFTFGFLALNLSFILVELVSIEPGHFNFFVRQE